MPVILIDARPPKIRNPIPDKWAKQITSAVVYVINVSDQTYILQRNYGVYFVKGVEEGQVYTATEVHGRITTMDEGENVRGQQMIEAEDIASDLCREINENILVEPGEESFGGAFVSATNPPSRKDLDRAMAKMAAFFDGQVRLGNKFHDDPNDHKNISALMRRAARARGQKPPWLFDSTPAIACAACGESLRAGVAICKTCGAVQPGQEERARKFFPERFANEEPAVPATEAQAPPQPPTASRKPRVRKPTTAPQP